MSQFKKKRNKLQRVDRKKLDKLQRYMNKKKEAGK